MNTHCRQLERVLAEAKCAWLMEAIGPDQHSCGHGHNVVGDGTDSLGCQDSCGNWEVVFQFVHILDEVDALLERRGCRRVLS